jgi:Protein of unknown function (DUF1232)
VSPIDLIPDFIPVIGYLDDLIIVPLGIALVIKLIPVEIMAEHRALAETAQGRPVSRAAAVAIIAIWIAALALAAWIVLKHWPKWLPKSKEPTQRGHIMRHPANARAAQYLCDNAGPVFTGYHHHAIRS